MHLSKSLKGSPPKVTVKAGDGNEKWAMLSLATPRRVSATVSRAPESDAEEDAQNSNKCPLSSSDNESDVHVIPPSRSKGMWRVIYSSGKRQSRTLSPQAKATPLFRLPSKEKMTRRCPTSLMQAPGYASLLIRPSLKPIASGTRTGGWLPDSSKDVERKWVLQCSSAVYRAVDI
ncbi:hypothetical protein DPMN_045218 [Dreissena polymorpha]|uniref:Uncharacterized protein n=1 Tax=Dreissena polymorpha TaxID=45954 RepID=A0A9D4HX56_DREPO|nr:hypothetical protein DPMN_045218 [Dreissena polymorpha]